MENYSILIPTFWLDQGVIDKFKNNMDDVLERICSDWEDVNYIRDGRNRRIIFTKTNVDFRPPLYICKNFDLLFSKNIESTNYIDTEDVKLLASKLHKEFEIIQGFNFELFIIMEYSK